MTICIESLFQGILIFLLRLSHIYTFKQMNVNVKLGAKKILEKIILASLETNVLIINRFVLHELEILLGGCLTVKN